MTSTPGLRSPVPPVDLRISVVICAYTEQRWEDLAAAVASIRAQTRPPTRTIVVVDHNPSLLERARVALSEVLVVANAGRPGLSGGRNTGISHAVGDVVAFLDDDARAEPDWLERLAAGYSDPSVVGVGGTAAPVWPRQRPRWLPPEFDWVVGCSFLGMPVVAAPVRNLIGANMSFRREVFETVGGFTDGLGRVGSRPLGCEETELGIRVRQRHAGVRLIYEPAAVVRHRVTQERMAWRYFCSRCYAEGFSKAMVARLVGRKDALETEQRYVRSVLPRAMVRALAPRRQHRSEGIATVGAMAAGLVLAAAGYARGWLRSLDQAVEVGAPSRTVENAFSRDRDGLFPIARITVTAGTTAARIKELLQGRGARPALSKERRRTRLSSLPAHASTAPAGGMTDMSDLRALDAPPTFPTPLASSGPPMAPLAWQEPPIRVMELELSEPIPNLCRTPSHNGVPYRQALVLVRLHREPIGLVLLELPDAGLPARELAGVVWRRFGVQIGRHLTADGEPPAQDLPIAGLSSPEVPPCAWEHAVASRDAALASVVVTTCDRPDQLLRTLDSLLLQTYPALELIVVDNRPGAGPTHDVVRRRYGADPRVRYVTEPRVGLSAARNAGLAHVHGEIVAFTDDDVTVDRHWLSSLAHAFLQHTDAACVTGLILPLELETRPQLWFEQFGGFGKGFQRRTFDLGPNRPPDALFPYTAGRFGSGANTAFRTGVLRALGGFTVELGAGTPTHGGEDLDAYLEVLTAGHQLLYEPRALAWHRHRPDVPGLAQQIHRYGIGLSAALTKRFITSRKERWRIIRRLPAGLAYALHPRSAKNTGKGSSYPLRLTILELAGMLRGPIAYGLARRSAWTSDMVPATKPQHPVKVEQDL